MFGAVRNNQVLIPIIVAVDVTELELVARVSILLSCVIRRTRHRFRSHECRTSDLHPSNEPFEDQNGDHEADDDEPTDEMRFHGRAVKRTTGSPSVE